MRALVNLPIKVPEEAGFWTKGGGRGLNLCRDGRTPVTIIMIHASIARLY